MLHTNLLLLESVTEKILKKAYDNKAEIDDAVNWSGLRCNEARFVETSTGPTYYEVEISEVDSEANVFKSYISKELEKEGYEKVNIVTCW